MANNNSDWWLSSFNRGMNWFTGGSSTSVQKNNENAEEKGDEVSEDISKLNLQESTTKTYTAGIKVFSSNTGRLVNAFSIEYHIGDPVLNLKQVIQNKTSIPIEQQHVTLRGKTLSNDQLIDKDWPSILEKINGILVHDKPETANNTQRVNVEKPVSKLSDNRVFENAKSTQFQYQSAVIFPRGETIVDISKLNLQESTTKTYTAGIKVFSSNTGRLVNAFSIEYHIGDPVLNLKQVIQNKTSIPIEQQQVTLCGKPLSNDQLIDKDWPSILEQINGILVHDKRETANNTQRVNVENPISKLTNYQVNENNISTQFQYQSAVIFPRDETIMVGYDIGVTTVLGLKRQVVAQSSLSIEDFSLIYNKTALEDFRKIDSKLHAALEISPVLEVQFKNG